MSPDQSVRETVTSEDGLMTYNRQGERVQVVVTYDDATQTEQLSQPVSREAVGQAVNAMRRRSADRMDQILGGLLAELLERLSPEGLTDDFFDPTFGPFVPLPDVSLGTDGVLSISPDRFTHTMHLTSAAGLSDRHVAENLVRAIMTERDAQLHRIFEEARRQVIVRLGSAERELD